MRQWFFLDWQKCGSVAQPRRGASAASVELHNALTPESRKVIAKEGDLLQNPEEHPSSRRAAPHCAMAQRSVRFGMGLRSIQVEPVRGLQPASSTSANFCVTVRNSRLIVVNDSGRRRSFSNFHTPGQRGRHTMKSPAARSGRLGSGVRLADVPKIVYETAAVSCERTINANRFT